jgi:hypothetical protein
MNAENMIGRCPEMWQWMCMQIGAISWKICEDCSRESVCFYSTSERSAKKAALAIQSEEGSTIGTT